MTPTTDMKPESLKKQLERTRFERAMEVIESMPPTASSSHGRAGRANNILTG